jgi:dTDP-4-amino-4,6-dideoxygalactose transaminase
MDSEKLRYCLAEQEAAETVLLVDHTFGYPAAAIKEWRSKYPDLLIIEDCVRALGGEIDGRPVGHHGDWVLFSLYKTTVGNDHGAVLLTRSPYAIRSGPAPGATLRQWASGLKPSRILYEAFKRLRCEFVEGRRDLEAPEWTEWSGTPNSLCQKRFENQLAHLKESREGRLRASHEIQSALQDEEMVELIQLEPGCRPSAFFLSFTVSAGVHRKTLVKTMHRKGFFLVWAWNIVPAFYACFSQSFPCGFAESVFLADRACHIPLGQYVVSRHRSRLIDCLCTTLRQISG